MKYNILLGFVQGITEFLPISSSAHLILIFELTNWQDQGVFTDVAAHAGTLVAVVFYLSRNIRNIIINNSNGFLVSDYKEWLNALRRLCDDIDLRKLIGNKGRRHVEKFYSLEVISEKYLDVIKKLWLK